MQYVISVHQFSQSGIRQDVGCQTDVLRSNTNGGAVQLVKSFIGGVCESSILVIVLLKHHVNLHYESFLLSDASLHEVDQFGSFFSRYLMDQVQSEI